MVWIVDGRRKPVGNHGGTVSYSLTYAEAIMKKSRAFLTWQGKETSAENKVEIQKELVGLCLPSRPWRYFRQIQKAQ